MNNLDLYQYLEKIKELISNHKYGEAVAHCQHILLQKPRHIGTYKLMGQAYLAAGIFQQASDVFKRVLSADPSDFDAHYGLALVAQDAKEFSQAIWHVEHAHEIESNNNAALELRESLYRQANVPIPEIKGMSLPSVARLYVRGGIYDQAVEELSRLLDAYPDRYDWKILLVEALWGSGKNVEALKLAESLLELLPNSIVLRAVVGDIWLQNERESVADQHLDVLQELVLVDKSHLKDHDLVSQILIQTDRAPERYTLSMLAADGSFDLDEGSWQMPELGLEEPGSESFDWIQDQTSEDEYISLAEVDGSTQPSAAVPDDADFRDDEFLDLFDDGAATEEAEGLGMAAEPEIDPFGTGLLDTGRKSLFDEVLESVEDKSDPSPDLDLDFEDLDLESEVGADGLSPISAVASTDDAADLDEGPGDNSWLEELGLDGPLVDDALPDSSLGIQTLDAEAEESGFTSWLTQAEEASENWTPPKIESADEAKKAAADLESLDFVEEISPMTDEAAGIADELIPEDSDLFDSILEEDLDLPADNRSADALEFDDLFSEPESESAVNEEDSFLLETNENADVGTGFTGWLNQVESDDVVSSLLPNIEPEEDSTFAAEAADEALAGLLESTDPLSEDGSAQAISDTQADDLFELELDLPAEEDGSLSVNEILADSGLLDDDSASAVQVTQVEDVGFTDWLSDFDGDSTDSIIEEMSDSGFSSPADDFSTLVDDADDNDISVESSLFEDDLFGQPEDDAQLPLEVEPDLPLLDDMADEAASPDGEDLKPGLTSWLGKLDEEEPVRSPAEEHPVSLPVPERSDVTEGDLASWLTEFDAGQDEDNAGMSGIVENGEDVPAAAELSDSDMGDLLSDGDVADLLAEGMPTGGPDAEPFSDDAFPPLDLEDGPDDLAGGSIFDRAEPFADPSISLEDLEEDEEPSLFIESQVTESPVDFELEGVLAGEEDQFHAADTQKDLFLDQEMLEHGDELSFDLDETLEDDHLDFSDLDRSDFPSAATELDGSAEPAQLSERDNLDWLGEFEEDGEGDTTLAGEDDLPVSDILDESGLELEFDLEAASDPLSELFSEQPATDEMVDSLGEGGAETDAVDDDLSLDELLFGSNDSADELNDAGLDAEASDGLELSLSGDDGVNGAVEDPSILSSIIDDIDDGVSADGPLEEISFDDFLAELEDEDGEADTSSGEPLLGTEAIDIDVDVIEGASEDMLRAEELSWLSLLEDAEDEKSVVAADALLPESLEDGTVDELLDLERVEAEEAVEPVEEPKSEYVTRPLSEEDLVNKAPEVEGEILNFAYEESLLGPEDEIELDSNMLEYANTATLPDWLTQSTEPTDLGVEIENKAEMEMVDDDGQEDEIERSPGDAVAESAKDETMLEQITTDDDLVPAELDDLNLASELLTDPDSNSAEPKLEAEFVPDLEAGDDFEEDLGLDELDALLAEVDTSEPALDIEISTPVRDEIESDEIFDLIDEAEAEIEAEYNRRLETSDHSTAASIIEPEMVEAIETEVVEGSPLSELELTSDEPDLLDLLDQSDDSLEAELELEAKVEAEIEPEAAQPAMLVEDVETAEATSDNKISDLEIEQNEAPQQSAQEIGLDRELEGNKMSSNPKQRPAQPEGDDLEETLSWLEELALYDTEGEIQVPTDMLESRSTAEPEPLVSEEIAPVEVEEDLPGGLEPSTQSLSWLDEIIPEEDDLENPPTARWDKAEILGAETSVPDDVIDELAELDPLSAEELEIDPELREVAQSSSLLDALDELDELDADGNLSISALLEDQETVHEEESDSLLAWINEEAEQGSESELVADPEAPVLPELSLDDDIEIDPEPVAERLDGVDSVELPAIDPEPILQDEPTFDLEPELPEVEASIPAPTSPALEVEAEVEAEAPPPPIVEEKPKKRGGGGLFGAEEEFNVSQEEIDHAALHGEEVEGFDIPDDPDSLMAWLNISADDLISDDEADVVEEPVPTVAEEVSAEPVETDDILDLLTDDPLEGILEQVDLSAETQDEPGIITQMGELPDDPDEAIRMIEEMAIVDEGKIEDGLDLPDFDGDDSLFDELLSLDADEPADAVDLGVAAEVEAAAPVVESESAADESETVEPPREFMAEPPSELLFGDLNNEEDSSGLDWLDDMTFDSDPALLGEIESPPKEPIPDLKALALDKLEALESEEDVPSEAAVDDAALAEMLDSFSAGSEALDSDLLGLDSPADDLSFDDLSAPAEPELAVSVEPEEPIEAAAPIETVAEIEAEPEPDSAAAELDLSEALSSDLFNSQEADLNSSIEDWLQSEAETESRLDWLDESEGPGEMSWLLQEEQASQTSMLPKLGTDDLDPMRVEPPKAEPRPQEEAPVVNRVGFTRDLAAKDDRLPSQIAPQPKRVEINGNVTQELDQYKLQISQGENLSEIIDTLQNSVSNSNDPRLLQVLGDAYMRDGQLQSALEAYRQAQRML